jgi:hypothetical protein
MFQLLLYAANKTTQDGLWSCVAVRPGVGLAGMPTIETELLEALAEALDDNKNPLKEIISLGGEVGEIFVGEKDVYCLSIETLTNTFIPLAVLPIDDASLVRQEMEESLTETGDKVVMILVPHDVRYKNLAYALASKTRMLKWW